MESQPDTEIVVMEFDRNKKEKVRAIRKHFNGRDLIDLRVYYKPEGSEEYRPGTKGLCLRADLLR